MELKEILSFFSFSNTGDKLPPKEPRGNRKKDREKVLEDFHRSCAVVRSLSKKLAEQRDSLSALLHLKEEQASGFPRPASRHHDRRKKS